MLLGTHNAQIRPTERNMIKATALNRDSLWTLALYFKLFVVCCVAVFLSATVAHFEIKLF